MTDYRIHLAGDYDAVLKFNDELQREAGEPGGKADPWST